MSDVLDKVWQGIEQSLLMAYEVWWALVLGFAISAIVQAWVPRERIEGALSGSGFAPVAKATGLGAASSSCSYAAISIARSLFSKGASAVTALAFQFASTNLVWELGLVLWVLIGWQFALAEYVGGILLIVLMAGLLRFFVSPRLEKQARKHAQQAESGHQHHMAGEEHPSWRARLTSVDAWSDVAHNFRGDWQMLWKEISIGFLLAGFIGLLGNDFFNFLFVTDAPPVLRTLENVIVGPIIAILSFVCSVGNVPLAAVLWSGGISFAGVIAFIFADLIVIPIVLAYRKFYGTEYATEDHRADVRHDRRRGADRRRPLRRPRPDPDRPPPHPHRHLRLGPSRLQALPQPVRPGDLRHAVLADPPARRHRPGLRDEGRPREGGQDRARRTHRFLLLRPLPGEVRGRAGIGSGTVPPGEAATDIQPESDSGASSVSFQAATKRYPGAEEPAVDGLTLEVAAGEICVFVGPSGCGKTTAMRMVNRMVEISEGDVLVGGESVRDREPARLRREIGYVIQEVGLFPHRTVAQNIGAVPLLLGWKKDRIAARSAELLELIGLDPALGERYPAQLSGGQQQRVGVARALAADPLVMLMDEPFGAIDPINRERLQNEFLRLQAEIRKTVLFVTHDIDEAIKIGDRIAILREGGHVAQYATPAEILMDPADEFVEDFVGADRALKRLALMRVADINLWRAPLARAGQPTSEVRAELDAPDVEVPYALLLDGEERPPGMALPARPRRRHRARAPRRPARPAARPRRRDARRARRPAAGRVAVRRGDRPPRPRHRHPLGRDHLRVPLLAGGEDRRASRRRATAGRRWLAAWRCRWRRRGEVGEGFFRERSGQLCQAKPSHLFCWDWARENIDRYGTPTLEQLEMVVISVVLGFVIAFALALIAHRRRWLRPPLLAGTGILYAIPSISFFLLLLPITGRSRLTAIIALSAYTLQIIYRNVTVGLDNVPESAKDSARGMGMTNRQVLWRVELPLALPEIVGGLRIATVSTIAIATLAVFAGAGGLGTQILTEANLHFPTTIVIAIAIVVAMAFLFDAVLLTAQYLATPWRRVRQ